MLQSTNNTREGLLCPQCNQNMLNMETLQIHIRDVHMKQPSTPSKGFFSFARQTIKNVQDSFKPSNEPTKIYAQYFLFNQNDSYSKQRYMGYIHSHTEFFKRMRDDRLDQISNIRRQLLLRAELLTNTNEYIPRNGNIKERRKYEQSIVAWMEDSVTSICASCSKSFGLYKRKHHCRLDGLVICDACSQFLSFSIARFLIDLNASSSSTISDLILQRFTNLKNITSTIINDGSNEDYLRICLSCGQFLQRFYDKIRFKNIPKDAIFHHYEEIVQAQKEYQHIHPTYSTIVDSLLNGETKYQIIDAHRIYQQLNVSFERIDSTSRLIAKLADSRPNNNENDTAPENRYVSVCRNIRTYSVQILQNYSTSTKRVPREDDLKRVHKERNAKLPLNNPPIKQTSLEEPKSLIEQYSQVIKFTSQAKLSGDDDEVQFLRLNSK